MRKEEKNEDVRKGTLKMEMLCKICNSTSVKKVELFSFRANMYRSKWQYLYCNECGTLQITDIPDKMDMLYNQTYESFLGYNSLKSIIFNKRYEACIKGGGIKSLVGHLVNVLYPYGNYSFLSKINRSDNILDIGCGRGNLLQILYKNGYTNCKGIDPFLNEDITYNGLVLKKADVFSFDEEKKYDVVMLNHVFEHMDKPKETLTKIKSFLKNDGMLSIEIPIINDFLWEKYGVYIDSLDPPFHLYLYTKQSMSKLLDECGFFIEEYFCTVSPLLYIFAKNAKDGESKERTLFASVYLTLKAFLKNIKINNDGNGNIARFICRIKSN